MNKKKWLTLIALAITLCFININKTYAMLNCVYNDGTHKIEIKYNYDRNVSQEGFTLIVDGTTSKNAIEKIYTESFTGSNNPSCPQFIVYVDEDTASKAKNPYKNKQVIPFNDESDANRFVGYYDEQATKIKLNGNVSGEVESQQEQNYYQEMANEIYNVDYCYYTSDADNLYLKIDKKNVKTTYIDRIGLQLTGSTREPIENTGWCIGDCGFMDVGKSIFDFGNVIQMATDNYGIASWTGKECPNNIVLVKGGVGSTQHYVYAFDIYKKDDSDKPYAEAAINQCADLDQNSKYPFGHCTSFSASKKDIDEATYRELVLKNANTAIVIDAYEDLGEFDLDKRCSIFGDVNQGGTDILDTATQKKKHIWASPAYVINKTLSIMRIVAIALAIVLGMVDFVSAVFAGNDEKVKKHQEKFVKRIIILVIIFLIPTFVNIIMSVFDSIDNLGDQCTIIE